MKLRYIYLFIFSLCFLTYFNCLKSQPVSDDYEAVFNNPNVEHQINFLHIDTVIKGGLHKVFKSNPVPYHATSVILHAVNCGLVYLLLARFFPPISALLGTCFFAVHPLHTEAVTWISGLGYIENSLFFLTVLLIYDASFFWYFVSVFLLALFGYAQFPWFILAGPLVLVYEVTKRGFKRVYIVIPYFIIGGIYFWKKFYLVQDRIRAVFTNIPVQDYIHNPLIPIMHSIANNFVATFVPLNITLYHEPIFITPWMIKVEAVFVLAILALSFWLYKRSKALFLGLMFFLVGIAPTLSPAPVAWLMADRYLYFPTILLSFIVAFLYANSHRKYGGVVLILIFLVFLGYMARTVARNEDYRTIRRYWEETAKTSPLSPRAHNEFGRVLFMEQNFKASLEEFKASLRLSPNYSIAWNNLAVNFQVLGDYKNAVLADEEAIKYAPRLFEANFSAGVIYLNSDKFDKSVTRLEVAHDIRPDNQDVVKCLDLAKRGLKGEKLPEITNGK